MTVTEMVHHPLVAHVAQDREVFQKNYIMSGLQELQNITYTDQSVSGTASSAYFSIKPPYGSLIDRNILLELTVKVTLAAGGGATAIGDYFCPKAMPANRLIDTCQIKVNGTAITSEPARYVGALSQYKTNQEFIKKYRSLSPTEPDHCNRYSNCAILSCLKAIRANGTNAGPDPAGLNAQAWEDTPLSPFGNSSRATADYECRGAFPYTRNSALERVYTFTEPLLNPFIMQREDTACAHITDLAVQLNFGSNLDRAFSHLYEVAQRPCDVAAAAGVATSNSFNVKATALTPDGAQGGINAFTITITAAKIHVKMGTPSIPLSIKQAVNYNEFQVNVQSLTSPTYQNNVSGDTVFNTVRLSCIPSHVFIFARPLPSKHTKYQADAFLAINKISMAINNKAGILSNMQPQQLYNMSAENGVNMSWGQWSKRVGSVLCLAFGKDVPQLLPGVREMIDITFTVNMTNTTFFDYSQESYLNGASLPPAADNQVDQSITWELVMLSVFPASITIEDNFAAKSIGITPAEAADAISEGPSVQPLSEVNQATGGSFGDWLHRTAHTGWHAVKKYAGPIAHMVANVAGAVPVVGSLAHMAADSMGSGALGGSRRRLKNTSGGGILLN